MTDTPYHDTLETRDPAQREADLMQRLARQVAHAQTHCTAYQRLLAGVDPATITSRQALAALPVTRKHELLALQRQGRTGAADASPAQRVFAGYAVHGWGTGMPRVFASPGPLYEPESAGHDHWRMARAMHAAGFRPGTLVHNSFAYHLVPAGAMMEAGARALGCTVFPGGTGQADLQLEAMADLRPAAYVGTPSFLRILLEKLAERGERAPIGCALVSGEACPPSLQAWFTQQGVSVYQCYASADLGLIAYETTARQGLVVDEDVIVELVRPGTGEPVAEGEVGEVVVTNFNPDYPLIRFGTGDLSAVLPGPCPTGRTNLRLKGWLGRADQVTKVRGMFVHPAQVQDIARRLPGAPRLRLLVRGAQARDELIVQVESATGDAQDAGRVETAVRDVTRLRAAVEFVAPGSLPPDGALIADERSYD
ncbi:MAG: Phenylacetate-coenzyme A ligase [Paracidovorax wautersii]|uniref:Phenylacetate-coenzyme A ligase n=1 Tax=Paracidovorax wautersii TaxID=1177982 RepID=A0A7V8FP64_9BURK|nr:MAG: Phenylacetate-coenzyme A ligase [Paracidovorax wautersii]